MKTVAGLALGAGILSSTARPALEVGNEAIGDPNADRAFLGSRGLSPGSVLDANMGTGFAAVGTGLGSVAGAAGGGLLGVGIGSLLKDVDIEKDIKIASKIADDIPIIGGAKIPLGGKTLLKAGKMSGGRAKAAMFGLGAIGAVAGTAFGASQYARSYVNRNKDFFESNPYSKGSAMQASSTGAYGDIVLGMHNSRRG